MEELKNLITLPGSYPHYLGLFVICDKFIQEVTEILDNEVTYPKNRNLLTRAIYQKVMYRIMNTLSYESLSKTPISKTAKKY